MNTTEVVMKIRPEKIQALTRFEAMTSGLIFTTARVVIITAKIAFIFIPQSAARIYEFHMFTVITCCKNSNFKDLGLNGIQPSDAPPTYGTTLVRIHPCYAISVQTK